ncbi:hypothetical protein ACTFTM_01045 [Micromonospora sp. RB23]
MAATAANDSADATGTSGTTGTASGATAAVGWWGTAASKRTAAVLFRRPGVCRTSAALTGRLGPSAARRPDVSGPTVGSTASSGEVNGSSSAGMDAPAGDQLG